MSGYVGFMPFERFLREFGVTFESVFDLFYREGGRW